MDPTTNPTSQYARKPRKLFFLLLVLLTFTFTFSTQAAGNQSVSASSLEMISNLSSTELVGEIIPVLDAGSFSDFGIGQEGEDSEGAVAVSADSVYMSLMILLLVLVAVILLLVFISANLVNMIRVREGQESYTLGGTMALSLRIVKNRYFAIAGNFVLAIVVISFLTVQARGVGLHQGYMPEQPIKYSHKLHAGDMQIDCQYCHSGASRGKNAWIPSVNVCWNCHKVVREGPKYGSEEIAKVVAAYENEEPIEWVRIHNLPDHVYFNHQQHVVVGNIQCQECHGPIEEMEVVYQYQPLSMGWCINCHRETEVNAELYDEIGTPARHRNGKPKTAAEMGALNCARCHY